MIRSALKIMCAYIYVASVAPMLSHHDPSSAINQSRAVNRLVDEKNVNKVGSDYNGIFFYRFCLVGNVGNGNGWHGFFLVGK